MNEWNRHTFKAYLCIAHILSILLIVVGFYIHLYLGIFSVLFILVGLLYIWFKAIDLIFEFKEYVKDMEGKK